MAKRLRTDRTLFTTTMVLLVVSLAFVYSASAVTAEFNRMDAEYFLTRQIMWVAVGLVCLLAAMNVPYQRYARPPLLWGGVAISVVALLVVMLVPPIKGTHRWLGIGGIGIQPSEFAKIVAIVFGAAVLGRRVANHEPLEPALLRVGVVVGALFTLIVIEPDYGTACLLGAVVAVMAFAAGLARKWVLITGLTMPGLLVAVLAFEPYRRNRVLAFLDPWSDPLDRGYHAIRSMAAVATGGVWGKGFMQGVQKMFYLPEAQSDYIYAVFAEETGLIGAVLLVACYGIIIGRGLLVSRRAPDAVGALLAVGVVTMIGLQALINMSVVVHLVPAKGIPLPLVSSGGSSMIVCLVAMGILLNVSQQASASR